MADPPVTAELLPTPPKETAFALVVDKIVGQGLGAEAESAIRQVVGEPLTAPQIKGIEKLVTGAGVIGSADGFLVGVGVGAVGMWLIMRTKK